MREQEDGARKVEPCSPHRMSTTESSRHWDASRSESRKEHSSRGSSHRDSSHRHSHGSGRSSADDPAFTPTRSKSSVPSNARTHPVADLRKDVGSRHGGLNHMHNHVSEEASRDRKRRRSEDEDEVWTEHRSSSGRIYFYNKKLDKSQWERPAKGLVKKAKPESQTVSRSSSSGGSSSSRTGSHSGSRTHSHSSSGTGLGSGSGARSSREHHLQSSSGSTGSSHTPSRHSHSAPRERAAGTKPSSSMQHHSGGQRSGSHSSLSSPLAPVVPPGKKPPPPSSVVSPSSQPLPGTPQTPTLPFPPPSFLNHTPRYPPPPFVATPESPVVVSTPQLPPQSNTFGPGLGQQNGPMVRPVPMSMGWAGGMAQPHPCPPPPSIESTGLHPLQKALFLQNQLTQPQQAFAVTSPAQLPLYPPPQLATPPPAMPTPMMMMAATAKPTPVDLHQHHHQPLVLQQQQSHLVSQQQQAVYIKSATPHHAHQPIMQLSASQATNLPSSHVLRIPMSRLGGARVPGGEIGPEFPDPATLKPPPPLPSNPSGTADFFSRVLSDMWWSTALDTCCKQMDRSQLESLSRNNVDNAYHCGQLARNLLTVECCRMIAVSRTTRLTHLRELMSDISSSK